MYRSRINRAIYPSNYTTRDPDPSDQCATIYVATISRLFRAQVTVAGNISYLAARLTVLGRPADAFSAGYLAVRPRLINTARECGRRGFSMLHVTLRVYHPLFSPLFTLHFVILSVSRLNRFTHPRSGLRPAPVEPPLSLSHVFPSY